jgi:hypothetical protein
VADLGLAGVEQQAQERRHAEVAGRIPGDEIEAGGAHAVDRPAAGRVVDGGEVDGARGLRPGVEAEPQGHGVALDQLAQAVADRLVALVARGEPVRAGDEVAGAGGLRQGVVGVDHLVGDPDGPAHAEPPPLGPEDRRARAVGAARDLGQGARVHDGDATPAQVALAREA